MILFEGSRERASLSALGTLNIPTEKS